MTTQQAPHTPPRRRFLSLPRTRLGWWAVALAGIASILFVLEAFPIPDPQDSVNPPLWNVALELIGLPIFIVAPLAGGVVGALALGAGERSLLVWFAQVPPAIFMAVLVNLFQEGSPWGRASIGVLLWVFWAAIAFSFTYLRD